MTAPWATLAGILILTLLAGPRVAEGQQGRLYRVGVVVQGGSPRICPTAPAKSGTTASAELKAPY